MALDSATAQSLQNIVDTINKQTDILNQSMQENADASTNKPSAGKKQVDSLQQYVKDLMTERKAAMKEVNTYVDNAKGLSKASDNLLGLSTEIDGFQKVISDVKKEYQSLDLESLNDATREQIETMLTYAEEQQATTEDLMRLSQALHEASITQSEDGVARKKLRDEQLGHKKVLTDLKDKTKESVSSFFTLNKSIALLTLGITRAILSMQEALKTQAPMMDLTAGSWENWTAKFGLSSTKFMSTVDENTQMMMANAEAGSDLRSASGQYLQAFSDMSSAAFRLTGDMDDASNLVASTMGVLSMQGVDLSFDNITAPADQLMNTLTSLAKVTNQTAEQNASALKMAMQDVGVRKSMLQLGKMERLGFVNRMAQEQLLLINKGMEAEAALEAVKALKGIAGQDPKERLKEAARMAAQAGSLGVSGGQEMIQLAMKPVSQWTKEETKRAQQFGTDMENAVSSGLGGEFGTQMSTFAIDAMSSGPFKDAIMGLSTAGKEGTAIEDSSFTEAVKSNTILTTIQDLLANMNEVYQRVAAMFSDIGTIIVGGIVVGLIALLSPALAVFAVIAASLTAIGVAIAAIADIDIGETISSWVPEWMGGTSGITDTVDKAEKSRIEKENAIKQRQDEKSKDVMGDYARERDDRIAILLEQNVDNGKAQIQVTKEMAEERKQATAKQTQIINNAARLENTNNNLAVAR
ncbi:MAG TPA: hypothetical protein ENK70_00225 [Methylophaga sp.]|nr:hypothetical protein [Methylophaga sp.]